MRYRCYNENATEFPYYGGKGVTICEPWRDYVQFLKDMGRCPSPEHSIDRIDNDGNYEPGNCRWATFEQQNNNTSKMVFVKDGLGYSQMGRHIGASDSCIRHRLKVGKKVDAPAKFYFMGENHSRAKLTEVNVRQLRKGFHEAEHPYQYILSMMKEFGMSEAALYNAARGKTWKHVI